MKTGLLLDNVEIIGVSQKPQKERKDVLSSDTIRNPNEDPSRLHELTQE